jgi:hypothetical protein
MLFEDFVFHCFEDFGLPIFVCSVPFLTENGRGENIREREREREREAERGDGSAMKKRKERERERGEL